MSSMDPNEESALARQSAFLADKKVTDRRREVHEGQSISATALVATIEPVAEEVTALSEEDEASFASTAAQVCIFVRDFGPGEVGNWSLQDLDLAFEGWLNATDRKGCSERAAIAILGSAFGQFCIEHLAMRWVRVSDASGVSLAVQGLSSNIRTYPFDAVAKRIQAREVGFLERIYLFLSNAAASGDYARDA